MQDIETQFDLFDFDMAEQPEIDELDFSFDMAEHRYINPGRKNISSKSVTFRNAIELAKEIGPVKADDRYFIMLPGTFVFGDFLEAWIIWNKYDVEEMTISTLSLSQNNIDSLRNLIDGEYLRKLNIIVSDYFFAHERNSLVGYMYHQLDINDMFQLAVSRVHAKICLIKTACGKKITIHGSANLRTSQNVEQIVIECDEDLFDFNQRWHNDIIEQYATIRKTVRKPVIRG